MPPGCADSTGQLLGGSYQGRAVPPCYRWGGHLHSDATGGTLRKERAHEWVAGEESPSQEELEQPIPVLVRHTSSTGAIGVLPALVVAPGPGLAGLDGLGSVGNEGLRLCCVDRRAPGAPGAGEHRPASRALITPSCSDSTLLRRAPAAAIAPVVNGDAVEVPQTYHSECAGAAGTVPTWSPSPGPIGTEWWFRWRWQPARPE